MSERLTVRFQIAEGQGEPDPAGFLNALVAILAALQIEWDSDRKAFHVWNDDSGWTWHGYGGGYTDAVLDWLAARLAIKVSAS